MFLAPAGINRSCILSRLPYLRVPRASGDKPRAARSVAWLS
ncbi:conserved hypothetical protein [Salmonella enterica subsp. enterica serovar Kentucky str. CDC 191]|nr:conserved hypothetical protein [Salmonella enterica subsp. enterica serovar Kentucky str. CDC 191]